MLKHLICLTLVGCGAGGGTTMHVDGVIMCSGAAANEYRVELNGSGFAEYQGKKLHAVTDINLVSSSGTCRTTSSTAIAAASFGIRMTNRTDDAAYPFIGAFIDVNGDGKCEKSSDLTWGIYGTVAQISLNLSADSFSSADELDVCSHF